jgi:hypothetical protein
VLVMKQHAKMQAELEVLRSFIVQERKRKNIKDVIVEWLPWCIIAILCYVIFKIAIGN